MFSAAEWPERSSRSSAARGRASTAAVSRLTASRKATIPGSAQARLKPPRAASTIIGPASSYEQGLQLQQVLEPEHPPERPLRGRARRHRRVVGHPGVVAGLDVERDLAEGVHVCALDLRAAVVAEPRPA